MHARSGGFFRGYVPGNCCGVDQSVIIQHAGEKIHCERRRTPPTLDSAASRNENEATELVVARRM